MDTAIEANNELREVIFDEEKIMKERKRITNPLLFRLGMLFILPLGFFTGMKVTRLDDQGSAATVRYKFLNKNPFKTTYWAVLGMAAEMAGGVILLNYAKNCSPSVATFVVGCDSKFVNRALGVTTFECNDGPLIREMVEKAAATGEGYTFKTTTTGMSEEGKVVAEFEFTWSVKGRSA